jgi:hypothetical protein
VPAKKLTHSQFVSSGTGVSVCGQDNSTYPQTETNGHDDSTKIGCSVNLGFKFPNSDETR